jgi:TM2 domain-containing membrane protein YozV/ribosomal protein L40E
MDEPYRESPVATLNPNKKHCFACAAILDIRAELCPRCGIRQPALPGMPGSTALTVQGARPLARTTKNKTTAGVFALVLGGLGIHKFYLGQTAAGIVYLLFCWTFIPAFIAFIEGLIFLTMSDEAFAEKYPG